MYLNMKINAINELREFCKARFDEEGGLKECKEFVEHLQLRQQDAIAMRLATKICVDVQKVIAEEGGISDIKAVQSIATKAFSLAFEKMNWQR